MFLWCFYKSTSLAVFRAFQRKYRQCSASIRRKFGKTLQFRRSRKSYIAAIEYTQGFAGTLLLSTRQKIRLWRSLCCSRKALYTLHRKCTQRLTIIKLIKKAPSFVTLCKKQKTNTRNLQEPMRPQKNAPNSAKIVESTKTPKIN